MHRPDSHQVHIRARAARARCAGVFLRNALRALRRRVLSLGRSVYDTALAAG